MHHINSAYTAYFNTKRGRSGHLFQGRYRAILIEGDAYAKELSRYIHLNPVRGGIGTEPEDYRWSSCQYYTAAGEAPAWLKRDFILGYFGKKPTTARRRYGDFIHSAVDEEYENPLAGLSDSVILGSKEFVAEIKGRFLQDKQPDRELPALGKLLSRPSLDQIEQAVDSVLQQAPKLARQVKLHLSHRYSGQKLREIGKRYGIGESGVTQASRRIGSKARQDKKLRKMIQTIERKIFL
jgi:hypothetical protein